VVRYRDVPDLLERFFDESGETGCWVTVHELRAYLDLDEYASPAISGFLRRIYCGSFSSFPYRVERIEKITLKKPHPRIVKRYLVTRRPQARTWDPETGEISSAPGDMQVTGKE